MPTESIPDVAETSAWADEHTVTFRLADPGHELAGVRLAQDVRIPGDRLGFHRSGDGWELVIDRPPVNRMEYLLQLRYPDGGGGTVLDPGDPRQVAGAYAFQPYLTELLGQASR